MSEFTFEEEKPKRPKMLSVLTILTFIGSGLGLLMLPLMMWGMKFAAKMIENNPDALEKMSAKEKMDYEKSQTLMALFTENLIIMYAITIAGAALCIFGAIRMRQLKKEGFYIYLLGEVVPIVVSTFVLGFAVQFNNASSYIFGMGIPALFIILYATQLKHLK